MKVFVSGGHWKKQEIVCPAAIHEQANFTGSRLKEAFFQILESKIIKEESVFWDVFSGSGQMGIEALSRGYAQVYFTEISSKRTRLIQTWLKSRNMANYQVACTDIMKDWKREPNIIPLILEKIANPEICEVVLFFDPPYDFFQAVKHPFLRMLQNFLVHTYKNVFSQYPNSPAKFRKILVTVQYPGRQTRTISEYFLEFQPRIEEYGSNAICLIQLPFKE